MKKSLLLFTGASLLLGSGCAAMKQFEPHELATACIGYTTPEWKAQHSYVKHGQCIIAEQQRLADSSDPAAPCTADQRLEKHGLVGELLGLPCTQGSYAAALSAPSLGSAPVVVIPSRPAKYKTTFHYNRAGRLKSVTTRRK